MVSWQSGKPYRSLREARQEALSAWARSVPGRYVRDAYRAAQDRGEQLTIPGAIGWSLFWCGWAFWICGCPGLTSDEVTRGVFLWLALACWAAGLTAIGIHWGIQFREWRKRLDGQQAVR